MKTLTQLQKFSRSVDAIENHIRQHSEIFREHEILVMNQIDARGDVEDAAVEELPDLLEMQAQGESLISGNQKLVIMPQTQEVWDEGKLLSALRITKEGAIAAGLLQVNQRPPRIVLSKIKED